MEHKIATLEAVIEQQRNYIEKQDDILQEIDDALEEFCNCRRTYGAIVMILNKRKELPL